MTINKNTGKILFVDNSKTTRFTMSKIFGKKGYNVETAASGNEAIELIQQGGFHLIIMDLYMPQMNGYEAAKKIRQLEGEISQLPIIALTASNSEKDQAISEEYGMNKFVVKSSDHKDLFIAVESYIS